MAFEALFRPELSDRDSHAFDAFVGSVPTAHYSQSRAWAMMGVVGRPMVPWYFLLRVSGEIRAAAVVRRVKGVGPLYVPSASIERGPVLAQPEDLHQALQALLRATHRAGILRLSLMPYLHGDQIKAAEGTLRALRFSSTQRLDGAHARTLRFPLEGADRLSKKVRAETRRAEREGASSRQASRSDLRRIAALHEQMMGAQRKQGRALPYFESLWAHVLEGGEHGRLFLCENAQGELLSFALVAAHGSRATYAMGASSAQRTPYTKMAPALLAAVAWAESAGCTEFDLGGIPMVGDTDAKRASIAEFKMQFVKDPTVLVGEHTRWF